MQIKWKAAIAWLPAWACFWIGDGVCRLMRLSSGLGRLYPIYNKCMLWSLALNDWGGLTLWRASNQEEKKDA